jgi:transcriptional regulator with XRE-family HTH domain
MLKCPLGDFMHYYKRIRDLREDNDLKQKEIAAVLGIDQRVYSNYELGKREIPLHLLIKLADYYKVSLDYLVGREK